MLGLAKLATDATPELTLPVGVTVVTLTVADGAGETASDDVLVSVAPPDGGEE